MDAGWRRPRIVWASGGALTSATCARARGGCHRRNKEVGQPFKLPGTHIETGELIDAIGWFLAGRSKRYTVVQFDDQVILLEIDDTALNGEKLTGTWDTPQETIRPLWSHEDKIILANARVESALGADKGGKAPILALETKVSQRHTFPFQDSGWRVDEVEEEFPLGTLFCLELTVEPDPVGEEGGGA